MAFPLSQFQERKNPDIIEAIYTKFLEITPFVANVLFEEVRSTSVDRKRRTAMPAQGFRALNGTVTPTNSTVVRFNTPIAHAATVFEIDDFLVKAGPEMVADELDQQVTAMVMNINKTCFKGDKTSNNEFDGLQVLTGDDTSNPERTNQTIQNAVGGGALSLAKLDEAIVKCKGTRKVIYMNEELYIRLQSATRDVDVSGNVQFTPGNVGEMIMRYATVPVVMAGEDVDMSQILPFTEANTTTSIYVVAHDNGPMMPQVGGIGQKTIEGDFSKRYPTSWDLALYIRDTRSVQRLSAITDAAIVA